MKQKRKYKQTTIKNMKFIDSDSLYNKFIDKNSVLVKIHDTIDFSFVNDLCDEFYSDNEARMMGKKENDVKPSYKSHVGMTKNRFITYTDVTLATVYDGHHAVNTIADLKSRGFTVPMAVGDVHFGDIYLRESMVLDNTQIIAPYRKNQATNSCQTNDTMIEAWAYNHTPEYKDHIRIRTYTEPKQGEMKNMHGMSRAKFRGLQKIRVQNYMSAIVANCKRLATAS